MLQGTTKHHFAGDAQTIIIYPGSVKTWTATPTAEERRRLPEAFERLWHSNDKDYMKYAELCRSRDKAIRNEIGRKGLQEVFDQAARARTPKDLQELAPQIDALPRELKRACKTVANTALGNNREARGLELFEEQYKVKATKPKERFTAIALVSTRFIIQLRGRVDGLAEMNGKTTVLEVKTRTRRLNRCITQERPQLELYLRLLNCERAILIETYGETMQTHYYYRDDVYYENLIRRLKIFVEGFHKFLGSPSAKRAYTAMSEQARAEYVVKMIQGRPAKALPPA